MHWFCSGNHHASPERVTFRRLGLLIVLAIASAHLAGCHSAYIETTVTNRTAASITLIQVEYPTAAFGTQALPPGRDFHYRFKILGVGPMKITYTDAAEKEHKATGPVLKEGNEGTLKVVVTDSGVDWQPNIVER